MKTVYKIGYHNRKGNSRHIPFLQFKDRAPITWLMQYFDGIWPIMCNVYSLREIREGQERAKNEQS